MSLKNKNIENNLIRAVAYMSISAFCFALMNITVRYLDHLPTFELVFFRALGSVVLAILFLKQQKIPLIGNNPKILIFRGIVGVSSMALFFKAVQLMPLASAVSLRYLSPFFAAGIAILVLGEKMKKIQWLFFLSAFLGVVLLKGFDTRISFLGLICILSSAFISGIVYVTLRKIGNSEHPIVVVNYFVSTALIVGLFFSFFNWQQPIGIQWLYLLLMGVWGFIAQIFMTKAFAEAEANIVSPLKYTEVIFTLLAGFIFFGEQQSWIALLAMFIISLSLFANVWVKTKK